LPGTLAYQPRTDTTDLPNALSGKRWQMSGSQIPKRIRQKGTSTLPGTLAYQPRMDTTDLPNAASGKRRQMSGSQIPKRIRQKGISTFSGTWALGQGWTGRISQMPPQENDRGSQANVQISNTKEDKAKVDKYIFRDLGFRPGMDRTHLPNASSGK